MKFNIFYRRKTFIKAPESNYFTEYKNNSDKYAKTKLYNNNLLIKTIIYIFKKFFFNYKNYKSIKTIYFLLSIIFLL